MSEKCCKHPKDKLEHCSCCDGIHCKACGKKWPEKEAAVTIYRDRVVSSQQWVSPPVRPYWQEPPTTATPMPPGPQLWCLSDPC